ncbi:O-methyltransferase [Terrilactibacillus laevilacticus]|uniref:tRNA 5-hydroxyuridine methyltransferase n=1 Tax=Terrilactibacillus laevilacticus TaxID=1380157 RepID=A0ABW5PTH3_9BACI|nr:O-methyltransferase [Terrilactibacillus laevilacticus]
MLSSYIASFVPGDDVAIERIEKEARERGIPIMQRESMAFLQQLIRWLGPKRILEIGTAVGFSAIKMHLSNREPIIYTIERDEAMYQEACENVKNLKLEEAIHPIFGDAVELFSEIKNNGPFDLIFIDAAKVQYQKFFDLYSPLLADGGTIVSDNILFHGLVIEPDNLENRRAKRLGRKMDQFNQWLSKQDEYSTVFLTLGDGLAISTKKSGKEFKVKA